MMNAKVVWIGKISGEGGKKIEARIVRRANSLYPETNCPDAMGNTAWKLDDGSEGEIYEAALLDLTQDSDGAWIDPQCGHLRSPDVARDVPCPACA